MSSIAGRSHTRGRRRSAQQACSPSHRTLEGKVRRRAQRRGRMIFAGIDRVQILRDVPNTLGCSILPGMSGPGTSRRFAALRSLVTSSTICTARPPSVQPPAKAQRDASASAFLSLESAASASSAATRRTRRIRSCGSLNASAMVTAKRVASALRLAARSAFQSEERCSTP